MLSFLKPLPVAVWTVITHFCHYSETEYCIYLLGSNYSACYSSPSSIERSNLIRLVNRTVKKLSLLSVVHLTTGGGFFNKT